MWLLFHDGSLWGIYSTEMLAREARNRAAVILGTTRFDERFNLYKHPVDWLSSSERQLAV